jgi:excisionase family DNA binding protein
MFEQRFLTMKMLTNHIHRSRSTIYKMVSNNTIPYIRLRRGLLFEREKIDQWVRSNGNINDDLPQLPQL